MKLYTDAELAQILDKDIFHLIGDTADELNLDCYVVGGYVRDLFLERPSSDIDVVVVAVAYRWPTPCARRWDARQISQCSRILARHR